MSSIRYEFPGRAPACAVLRHSRRAGAWALGTDFARRSFMKRTLSSPASKPDDAEPAQEPASLGDCRRWALWRNATQAVPGAGPRRAVIMLVGEQPGDQEDRQVVRTAAPRSGG